jgi:protein SCO1
VRPALRLTIAALLIVLAIGLGLALSLGSAHKHSSTSPSQSSSGFDGAPLPGQQPYDFTLIDQRGHRVSLSEYRGRVVLLTFLSTAPGSAAAATSRLMAQQIRGALAELGGGVPALAVSTSPDTDTRARVRAFLSGVSLTNRLEYLTGTTAQLRAIWHTYAITPPRQGEKGPNRAAYVVLIDKRGVQRVRFYVEQLTPEALAHDIRRLQAD